MLAPISWLKDYVDIKVSAEVLAQKLVAIGFEVENIIYQNKRATNVVVGKITHVEKHPNADRLRVTKIDVGSRILQVVTNVPVLGGEIVAVALDGAKLADGHEIKRGELRGVLSEGMLCGLEEVGLSADEAEGQAQGDILRFGESVRLGTNALDALGFNDVILDVAITANRPDCNSIYKLAKEVAVALGVSSREPHINFKTTQDGSWNSYDFCGSKIGDLLKSVEVENPELCPRYMAAGVKNIHVRESSPKIKSRLRAVGIRPINNIVDITNYVLTEIGQPMHAFDSRDLEGAKIVVRNARDGETCVTLDGKNNKLTKDMLVICDADKPVAIAGVMGGENSGVKEDTHEIIFEAAKFARDNIRRTSRALNLRSDSSSRFEKGIDFASQQLGLERALTMIYESDAGDILDGVYDVKTDYQRSRLIKFTRKDIRNILGCAVPEEKLVSTLRRLGIEVSKKGDVLVAHVGEDREDIAGINDIAEEFIRVYGYDHIKPTLFKYAALTEGGASDAIKLAEKIRDTLCACGFREAVTYSFTSPAFSKKLALPSDDARNRAVKIVNPIGEALSVMRTTLAGSMLEALKYNASHFVSHAELFEVARVYLPKSLPLEELPDERERVCIGMFGGGADFFKLKAACEDLFKALNAKNVKYTRSSQPFLHPGRGADVHIDGVNVGYLGEIHPDVAANYDVDNFRLYIAEFDVEKIGAHAFDARSFSPITRFPTMERDLAVIVNDDVFAGDMLDAAKSAGGEYLEDAKIFDTYKSELIGEGKKSVAMRFLFSNLERTLTDGEINEAMDNILTALQNSVGAKIR